MIAATLGLSRVELRGLSSLAAALTGLMCVALLVVRAAYEAGPETLLVERNLSLWLLSTVILIPVVAELFGGGRGELGGSTLSNLPLGAGTRALARLFTVAVVGAATWTILFAWDRILDPTIGIAVAARAFRGTEAFLPAAFGLSLLVAASVGAVFRNALIAALVGFAALASGGVTLFALEGSPVPSSSLDVFHIARQPLCLAGCATALAWTLGPRGARLREGWCGTSIRFAALVFGSCLGAAVALGSGSIQVRFSDVLPFHRPGIRIGYCLPSPDGRYVAINVHEPGEGFVVDAWVLDVESGEARLAIPRARLAKEVLLQNTSTYAFGWLSESASLAVGTHSQVYQDGSSEYGVDVVTGTVRPFRSGESRPHVNPRTLIYGGPNRDTLLETTGATRLFSMGEERVLALWSPEGVVKILHLDGSTLKVLRDPGNF